jgi:CTP:molybdopterin cytidylyltransferase MocA
MSAKKIERRKIVSVKRTMTPEERARWSKQRALVESEKNEILALGRRFKQEALAEQAALTDAVKLLRAERERQGLSLSDVQARTKIDRSTLSTLENADRPNPTIGTLSRIAEALGKSIQIVLADRS